MRVVLLALGVLALCALVACRPPQYWEEQMLAYQISLQSGLPYNSIVQPYAHNAYNGPNPTYTGDPFKRPTLSMMHQERTIPELLDMGLRHISLEVHWIQQLGAGNELHVCRTPEVGQQNLTTFCAANLPQKTFCLLAGIEPTYGSDTGCWQNWDRPLLTHLTDINTWLIDPANAGEFVHVQLMWRLNSTAPNSDDEVGAMARIDGYLSTLFGSRTFRSSELVTAPVWPTLASLQSLGKQLAVTCVFNCTASPWVHRLPSTQNFPSTFKNIWDAARCCSQAVDPTCNFKMPQSSFYYVMEDLTSFANISASLLVGSFSSLDAFQTFGCGVHTARDRIDYPMMTSLSWTWDNGEPTSSVPTSSCAYVSAGSQRWQTQPCAISERHACKTATNTWVASTTPGAATSASCPAGSTYATPRSPQESKAIAALAQSLGVSVWINAASAPAALPNGPAVIPRNVTFATGTRANITKVVPRQLSPVTSTSLFFDQCKWQDYGQSVASRTGGMIALACIGLAISCVFGAIIAFCCCKWIRGKAVRKVSSDQREMELNDGPMDKRYFLFILPFALIISGSVILIVGNREMDLLSKNFTATLRDRSDQLGLVKFALDSSLANLSRYDTSGQLNVNAIAGNITDGFEYLNDNIADFSYGIDQWSVGRNIVTIVMPVLAVFFIILGLIVMIRRRHHLLILILIVVNFVVFLSFVTVLVNSLTDTVAKDMCYEVDRPAGLFDVLQSKALFALNSLTDFANKSIDRITVEGCTRLDQICSYGLQVCSNQPCNIDLLIGIGDSVTLNDNGTIVYLRNCPFECSDPGLRDSTTAFGLGVSVYEMYVNVMSTLNRMLEGLIGETMRSYLHEALCVDLAKALPLIYTGAAMLMAGLLSQMALHFWLGWKAHKFGGRKAPKGDPE